MKQQTGNSRNPLFSDKSALFELLTVMILLLLGGLLTLRGLPGMGLITVAGILAVFSCVMRVVPEAKPVVVAEQS